MVPEAVVSDENEQQYPMPSWVLRLAIAFSSGRGLQEHMRLLTEV